jgi:hypothetical protein
MGGRYSAKYIMMRADNKLLEKHRHFTTSIQSISEKSLIYFYLVFSLVVVVVDLFM